ncbi:GTPase [uncultured Arthrobacter sp.]|uniref:GTPase n=1 Tax=uncultured Arthrobacter sp. TaxID=114050 RepID=UPI0025D1CE73|nr:GTPase [uncultured Arthrobacter sp.]
MSRHRGAGSKSGLHNQLEALDSVRGLAEGRLPDEHVQGLFGVLDRASSRRSLSADHTVIGIFGPTGSGKSSLINALSGTEVARVAARRPTTSKPLAVVWGAEGSGPLLDWLEVDERHEMPANAALLGSDTGGLILLDLPDFDSTAAAHRTIVERMSGQVDVLLWVVDPQKYADAALHHDFLAPLASHGAVTLVALNQADRLSGRQQEQVTASLSGILAEEGLRGVRVFPVSARTRDGLDDLAGAIRQIAGRKQAANARLAADVAAASTQLAPFAGPEDLPIPGKAAQADLSARLAAAAGVDAVVDAVVRSYRRDAHAATGWPVTRWLGSLRSDPLRRLNLRRSDVDAALRRTSMPSGAPAQRARVDQALRTFADTAAGSSVEPWRSAIRSAARGTVPTLLDGLDQALAGTNLDTGRRSWWWPLVGLLQWLALAALVVGLGWLGVMAAMGFLQFDVPDAPSVEGFPVPTLLIAGGVAAGILLAVLASVIARFAAKARGRKARRRLRAACAKVAETVVAQPVIDEIGRYNDFRAALAAAGRTK